MTAGEREAAYSGVCELVENRKRKAGSMSGATGAAATSVKERPRFEISSFVSGYAPGVNDENLTDVIRQLEEEDDLWKLGLL